MALWILEEPALQDTFLLGACSGAIHPACYAYTAHWWTDTEGFLAAAVEEMRPGYDQLMIPVINNIPVLIVVIVLTIPIAILAMRLINRRLCGFQSSSLGPGMSSMS